MGESQETDDRPELVDDDTINFKVYDMPIPLVKEYVSMAKLHYDNEVWRVLADAMHVLKERQMTGHQELEERIEELEARVEMMKAQMDYGDDISDVDGGDGLKPTFGASSDTDSASNKDVENLKSLKGD